MFKTKPIDLIQKTGVLVMGAMAFLNSSSLLGQTICSATNSYGCSIDWFDGVTIKNSSGQTASFTGLTCSNTGSTNKLLTSSPCIDILPGEEIEMTISNGCSYSEWAGVWLDLNRDNQFQKEECLSGPSGPFGKVPAYSSSTVKIKVPCISSASGSAILRVRCLYSNLTTSSGCGTLSDYGNIIDLEVNILKVSAPTATFTVPTANNYTKAPIKFPASGGGLWNYTWKFDQASKVISDKSSQGIASWDNAGTYDVSLKVDFCGISDSATKTVKIVAPTVAPNADFIASTNEIELGYDLELFDLSDNGAHTWSWEILSPTGIDDQFPTDQNPKVTFSELGFYNICLTSSNDVGSSKKFCKSKYIEVLPTLDNYMGPQKISDTRYGRLFDHAGPTGDYSNGRKPSIDYFKIIPCGAKEIRLKFKDLKLADAGDKLRIYDSDESDPNKEITGADGINGLNYKLWDTAVIKCYSGAVFITFETNGSGVDRGFNIEWDSDLNTPTLPEAKWETDYYSIGTGVQLDFKNKTENTKGVPSYAWEIDGVQESTNDEFSYTFQNTGTFNVCLIANTCTGSDTACKNIVVSTPTTAMDVDFKASNLRPNIGQVVSFTTQTNYADVLEWSIFPTTFKYENGTSSKSKNPQISFTAGGAYTFTLSAYNYAGGRANTEKKVIKNKYVVCLDYCIPITNLTSKDVSITNVELTDQNNRFMVKNQSEPAVSYTLNDQIKPAKLTFGGTYNLLISRKTSSNPLNYKAWIDWNIDGDFDDANEEILSSGTISSTSTTASFTVPNISNCFPGVTRLRVAASYGSLSNSPCGVNQVGEFEDYLIDLVNDNLTPVISLVGSDTVRVEKSNSLCYQEIAKSTFTALDPTEGDISNKVTFKSDLDCSAAGIYSIELNVEDASGNKATPKTRTIIVVLDRTAPVLTLQGNDTITIEQCGTFADAGAVASDNVDGDLTSAIKTTGSVDPSVVGDYILVYTISDAQGNSSTKNRIVKVRDTKKPGIYRLGKRITDGMNINVQINQAFVDDIYALDECNGNIFLSVNPGFNGVVNNQVRATYPVVYGAKDPSGNEATEQGFTVNYIVDDFIAPNIELNTEDTVIHNVNESYYSRSVTLTDNYYGSSQISLSKTGTVDPYTLGIYVEKYIAADPSGNKATKMRYVKVVDRIAPSLTAPAVSACVGTPFWAMTGLIMKDNYYSADDLKPLVKVLQHNVNIWEAGVYSIVYQVSDPSGNQSKTVVRDVYVNYPPNCQNTYMDATDINKQTVKIYPNPSNGQFNIDFSQMQTENTKVTVLNGVGQVVYENNFNLNNSNKIQLDLQNLAKGVYQIQIQNQKLNTTESVIVH